MGDPKHDIQIFNQTTFSIPLKSPIYSEVATSIEHKEECSFNFVEVVYVDEDEIVRINKEHLGRDYITDIITFRYDDPENKNNIEGTMFCCAPRIIEQAKEFNETTEREFLRIYIHGLLHLIGYEDKSDTQKEKMADKENYYLDFAGPFF